MIGGPDATVDAARSDLQARSRPASTRPSERTPGRTGDPAPEEQGYLHCGPERRRPLREDGAQRHRVRAHGGVRGGAQHPAQRQRRARARRRADAETAPLRNPEAYSYDLDVAKVAEVWRRGSVVASWLLDLTASALNESPTLDEFSGRVSDSGEGRWTVAAAIDEGVPAPVIATALFDRFTSQGQAEFGNKLLSAMRKQFGGHDEKPATP